MYVVLVPKGLAGEKVSDRNDESGELNSALSDDQRQLCISTAHPTDVLSRYFVGFLELIPSLPKDGGKASGL
jgi:hypothetical protein